MFDFILISISGIYMLAKVKLIIKLNTIFALISGTIRSSENQLM